MKKVVISINVFLISFSVAFAQANAPKVDSSKAKSELKINLSLDGSKYLKATFLNQIWVRNNESNPGTLVNGEPQNQTFDIGLRRTRLQLYGQISDHVFFYTQFGMNNFNYLSSNAGNRKLHAFFHDALGEYKVFKNSNAITLGSGLTIANGLSRFTQPSVGSIMTADVPVFLQATVDQTDEFARRLALFARGHVGKFDYRVVVSDPFPIQTNGQTVPTLGKDATFTTYGHSHQYAGLFIYNFKDKEPHITPYMAGTYLGEKKIVNLEGGIIYQPKATWSLNGSDTMFHPMLLWSLASFADMPIQNNKYMINAYAGFFHTDYGPNYIRNNGIMNPANGSADANVFSGAGNAYPMFGTGNSIYLQGGLRLPNDLFKENGTLMPYFSYRWSKYDKLKDAFSVVNLGVNWLINKHQSKVSLNYELRPVFLKQNNGDITNSSNAGSAWIQYQTFF